MKKILIPVVLMSIASMAFCQETVSHKPVTKADFLKKSKNQKIAGFVFLGVGAGILGIASAGEVSFNSALTIGVISTACILTSIPLFIASGRNKRKARALAFLKTENNNYITINNKIAASYPAVALRLKL